MPFNKDGIYHIHNSNGVVRIALASGSSVWGTHVTGWSVDDDYPYHLWLIKSTGEEDTYTIQNAVAGTYMDMAQGSAKSNTPVVGWHADGRDKQKWIIKQGASGHLKVQNKATSTFLDLHNGGTSNGTGVVGWAGEWGSENKHQLWDFIPQSIKAADVRTALNGNPYTEQIFKNYASDATYLILSETRHQEIWRNLGLANWPQKRQIFDSDDWAFLYKGEVGKWGENNFKADGFTILCGVAFGRDGQGRTRAYNWSINPDKHGAITFFDPQAGTFQENIEYTAYFGVF